MYGPFCWRNPSQASGGAYRPREQVNWPRPLVTIGFQRSGNDPSQSEVR